MEVAMTNRVSHKRDMDQQECWRTLAVVCIEEFDPARIEKWHALPLLEAIRGGGQPQVGQLSRVASQPQATSAMGASRIAGLPGGP